MKEKQTPVQLPKAYYELGFRCVCPICKKAIMNVTEGTLPILILSEVPGFDLVKCKETAPFSSWIGYKLIKPECMNHDVPFYDCYTAYAIGHDVKSEDCETVWHDALIDFLKENEIQYVMAHGKSFKRLTGKDAGDTYGLWTPSALLKEVKVTPAPSQEALISAPIGDYRVGLKLLSKAAERLRKMK